MRTVVTPAMRSTGRKSKFRHKTFIRVFLLLALAWMVLEAAIVYWVDPLQFYRKASFYQPVFSREQRYQNPGIALHYDYNTIIIGSSMTENFVPSHVDRKLGVKSVKLSIEGSTAKEHHYIAEVAIRTGKVKRVLWGLDYFSLRQSVRDDQGEFPYYLYDRNPWNDYRYLLNLSSMRQVAHAALSSLRGTGTDHDLELLNNWDKAANYGTGQVIQAWEKAKYAEQGYGTNEDSLGSVKKSFDDNIVSLVKAHPEIRFQFYYPPYSILRHQVWYATNKVRYGNQLKMKKYMFDRLRPYPNAEIYEFQQKSEITYDLDQYKDLSHHSQAVNERIIDAIAANRNRVTADNVEEAISQLEREVTHLMVEPSGEVISAFIEVNGKEPSLAPAPAMIGKRLSVPLKAWLSALGATFSYDAQSETLTAVRNTHKLILRAGSRQVGIDGLTVEWAAAPEIRGGSMMAPLVEVSSALGCPVKESASGKYLRTYSVTAIR